MAWTDQGSIRGPAGEQGPRGIQGPAGERGPEGPAGEAASAMYGELGWAGPMYNPPTRQFLRLRYGGDGRLRANRNIGGTLAVATNDTNCYLYAPVNGIYTVTMVQCWSVDTGPRGCGLGTNIDRGDANMICWNDIGLGRFCTATATVYLPAGTRLYPWTWSDPGVVNMTGNERGIQSKATIALLSPA